MKIRCISIAVLLFIAFNAGAQLKIYPIKSSGEKQVKNNNRITSNTLTLPFWDDFSTSYARPDTVLWQDSENVFINTGLGLNPPSINVASFDGLQVTGNPYSVIANNTGPTDSLKSCPIDLSSLSVSNNVFVSFFYQFAGLGDQPEPGDSLRLEFKNASGDWINVWPKGQDLDRSGEFTQVILRVDQSTFFHNSFQFKFQSFGRQSGPFDVWNLDYVYVNSNRNSNDIGYPDRAVSHTLSSIFNDYSIIPKQHVSFENLTEAYLTIFNLDNAGDAPQPYTINLDVDLLEYKADTIFKTTSYTADQIDPRQTSPVEPGKVDTVHTINLIPEADFMGFADTTLSAVNINYKVTLNSNDFGDYDPVKYSPIDFTINDTIYRNFRMESYYAYDDGSAELGAGLNFGGDQLAYKFNKLKDTVDYITAIDVYFPFVNSDPIGRTIDISVWNDENGKPGNRIFDETISIWRGQELNEFIRIDLSERIIEVGNIFYIGYRQNSNGDLAIGLDKNTDSGGRIFYNLTGAWEQNTTVKGSLMLRPVFTKLNFDNITGRDPMINQLNIFPNPSNGIYKIHGEVDHLHVLDIHGRTVKTIIEKSQNELILHLIDAPAGIYIVKIKSGSKIINKKVLKQ